MVGEKDWRRRAERRVTDATSLCQSLSLPAHSSYPCTKSCHAGPMEMYSSFSNQEISIESCNLNRPSSDLNSAYLFS